MVPDHITRDHVVEAIQEIQEKGVPKRRRSTKYSVLYNGEKYPPKYVISLAHKAATGRKLPSSEFSGGRESNRFLEERGFEIEQTKSRSSPSNQTTSHTTRTRKASSATTSSNKTSKTHTGENCKACKSTILELLQRIFGEATREYSTTLSTRVEDYEHSEYSDDLQRIYKELMDHRGHRDFVSASSVRPYDYFVPDPGIVIEFDESQHFTAPRRKSLESYPDDLPLGYDRQRWISLCTKIDASDPDPVYRDEQRAWYDTLRDFAPHISDTKPNAPVVRLYAKDREWCQLDPSDADDVERFQELLKWRIDRPEVEVRSDPDPTVARVILTSDWSGEPELARKALETVCSNWPTGQRVSYLLTCGGFLQFEIDGEDTSMDTADEAAAIEPLLRESEEFAREFLNDGLDDLLCEYTRYVSLGVDSAKRLISTTANRIDERHIEAVVLADLEKGTYHTTAKSYPTSGQERTLIRNPDFENHFVEHDDGSELMVLGCHDLTMYNPRGIANAGGHRKRWGEEFRALAKERQPKVVLQHPHTADTPNTWRNAWKRLEREHPSVEVYAGAGKHWKEDGARADVNDVLTSTKKGPTLDFVLRSSLDKEEKDPPS